MKKWIIIAVVVVLAGVGILVFSQSGQKQPVYKTEKVSKGTVKATVTATGTLNAVTTVLVGTQVSGTIKALYVDYNSPVRKNQALAQIDPATFQAQVDQARANLLAAQANVEKAEAVLFDARRTLVRNRSLFAKNFIARSDLDTSDTAMQSADAQLSAARAQVEQSRAALKLAETNLHYTRILSPVDGTVISRSVDVGQTVAASFQTPTLFNIAQDLTKMQIDTNVDEADIGRVRVGQSVAFTVDAYPETAFKGEVLVVRNAPITIQNVVTYDVVVQVANPELKLKPGMTANVSIATATREGVLKIPNAALRFRPPDKNSPAKPTGGKAEKRGPGVWILAEGKPVPVRITTGISDGQYTEVASGDMKEGQEVIVEAVTGKKDAPPAAAATPRFIR